MKTSTTYVSKITMYKSLIKPHFDYCASILFLANEQRLQKLQNKIMRNILGCNKYTPVKDMLAALNFQPIKHRVILTP